MIEDAEHIDEELRLKYRYLDLRRPEMLERIKLRHEVFLQFENFCKSKDFLR